MVITHHHSGKKKEKRKRNESNERLNFLKKIKTVTFSFQVLFKFYRRAIEKQTGNITARDRKTLQMNIIGTHLPSIRDMVRYGVCTEPKEYYKTTPTPATVCSPRCCPAKETEATEVPPDNGAASFLRLKRDS